MTLTLVGVSKRYGETHALSDINLTFEPGQVHALVGENGAGKSTCLGILGGRVQPSTGRLEVSGTTVSFSKPRAAADLGIQSIYQELSVLPNLTALQNVFLGQEIRRHRIGEDRAAMLAVYVRLAERLQVRVHPDAEVGDLSIGDQQMVEVMRCLVREPKAVLFDEPTAALGPREREALYRVIRELRDSGVMVLFVSHNLDEVLSISDRVSVFRDGRLCETRDGGGWDRNSLMRAMVGHVPEAARSGLPRPADGAPVVLRVEGLSDRKLHDVTFELGAGEIVGVAGLVGAGRTSLLRALSGATIPHSGRLILGGAEVPWPSSVRVARNHGIAFLTEDRKKSGILAEATTRENIMLGNVAQVSTLGVVANERLRSTAATAAAGVKLAAGKLSTPIGTLSGGNQQKALLARVVQFAPRVLLADEPTRGVDVGAKAEIAATLQGLAREGTTVLMVSSEFEELVENCHRVLVMWHGRIVAELHGDDVTVEAMVSSAFGAKG